MDVAVPVTPGTDQELIDERYNELPVRRCRVRGRRLGTVEDKQYWCLCHRRWRCSHSTLVCDVSPPCTMSKTLAPVPPVSTVVRFATGVSVTSNVSPPRSGRERVAIEAKRALQGRVVDVEGIGQVTWWRIGRNVVVDIRSGPSRSIRGTHQPPNDLERGSPFASVLIARRNRAWRARTFSVLAPPDRFEPSKIRLYGPRESEVVDRFRTAAIQLDPHVISRHQTGDRVLRYASPWSSIIDSLSYETVRLSAASPAGARSRLDWGPSAR